MEGKVMSKNNSVRVITPELPILNRMRDAVMEIYMDLSEKEMRSLQAEILSVTETNCDYKIYEIAQMLKSSVDVAVGWSVVKKGIRKY